MKIFQEIFLILLCFFLAVPLFAQNTEPASTADVVAFFRGVPFIIFHVSYSILATLAITRLVKRKAGDLMVLLNIVIFGFFFFLLLPPFFPYIFAAKYNNILIGYILYGIIILLAPVGYYRYLRKFYFSRRR